LLDIVAILARGDVRGEVLKELERQLYLFDRYSRLPGVDESKLNSVLRNLRTLREDLNSVGPQYLQGLRESEFLSAIKHRSAIPGGTCEFDLPDYSYWLRRNFDDRSSDLGHWTSAVRALCDSVAELLWVLRESGESSSETAPHGVHQHALSRDSAACLLRVSLPGDSELYPEISGSQHRFTVRFMNWSHVDSRPAQTTDLVDFKLTIC
jgi:cell division protein ZapD